MKLMNVTLSMPYITYQVDVQYRIRRKPVIMEWAVIQMIAVAEHLETYADVPVSILLEKMFGIVDVDKLVRPVMIGMRSSGLITVTGLTDDTPLQEIRIGACALTEDGRQMLRDGTLPSQTNRTVLPLTYDVIHQRLIADKPLQPKPAGVPVFAEDDLQAVPFPLPQIQSYLAEAKKKKTFSWLREGTEIPAIAPIQGENGTKIGWNNIQRPIDVGAHGVCRIQDYDTPEILQRVAAQLDLPMPEEGEAWPETSVEDTGSSISAWTWPEAWKELLGEKNAQRALFLLRASDVAVLPRLPDKKAHRVVLLSDSETFGMEVQPHQLIVHIHGTLLAPEIIVASTGFAIHRGRFSLDFGGAKREVALAYVPRQEPLDVTSLLSEIVRLYAAREPRLVILLLLSHQEDAFREQTQIVASAIADLGERAKFLQALRHLAGQFSGMRNASIPDDWMEDLLIGDEVIRLHVHTPKDMGAFLAQLKTVFKGVSGGYRSLLPKAARTATMALPSPSGIQETWEILDQLAAADASCLAAVEKEESCLSHLYPESVVRDFVVHLTPELVEQAAGRRLPIERSVVWMPQIVDRILYQLGASSEEECSAARIRKGIVQDGPEKLRVVYDLAQQWVDAKMDFSRRVMDFSDACIQSAFLQKKAAFMESVMDVLAEFCDPQELRYPSIAVPDTNALLHHPELIEALQRNGSYLLLVPATVLQELDGLKHAEEAAPEEEQMRAKVSRHISSKLASLVDAGADWVLTGVESHPDLIPEELRIGSMENDMRILSVALQYNAKPVYLITDDNNLKLMSKNCHGIKAASSENFLQMLAHSGSMTADKGKRKKKKKK